jgi:hypothetical protein
VRAAGISLGIRARCWLCIGVFAYACAPSLAASGPGGLIGNENAGSLSGLSVTRGEPVASFGLLEDRTGRTVMLKSATVLPLTGFRVPRLVGVAVERKGSTFRGVTVGGAARGWPPSGIRVRRLSGYRLQSGSTLARRTAVIVFGVVARSVGRYAVAGVNVRVRMGGTTVTVKVIGPLAFCVDRPRHVVPCPDGFTTRALRASQALKGQ